MICNCQAVFVDEPHSDVCQRKLHDVTIHSMNHSTLGITITLAMLPISTIDAITRGHIGILSMACIQIAQRYDVEYREDDRQNAIN